MAYNCNNTKYDKTFVSAYQILRMNKPYLSDEALIRWINPCRTDIEISYTDLSANGVYQSDLSANGLILPTVLSKFYSYIKVYHAYVVPTDTSIPRYDLAVQANVLVLTAANNAAVDDSQFCRVKINLNNYDNLTGMTGKTKKITLQIRVYNPNYYCADGFTNFYNFYEPEFRDCDEVDLYNCGAPPQLLPPPLPLQQFNNCGIPPQVLPPPLPLQQFNNYGIPPQVLPPPLPLQQFNNYGLPLQFNGFNIPPQINNFNTPDYLQYLYYANNFVGYPNLRQRKLRVRSCSCKTERFRIPYY